MDFITIRNLEVFSKHGVFAEENKLGQKFAIDVKLYFDTRVAGVSDDISKSVDYGKVCHFITAFMKGHTYKLIETAAERLAEEILIEYPVVNRVLITLKKPWAPIGLPLEEVSVTIDRGWHSAYLSLGSNMGDKEGHIIQAMNYLSSNDRIVVVNESSMIETEPYGNVNQDKFINCAIEIRTLHTPKELLTFCKNLEKMAGRVKTEHWGPRPLDIDILFFDDIVYDSDILTIPHADMHNRLFVLEPLFEIASFYRHPILNKTVREMLLELKKKETEAE